MAHMQLLSQSAQKRAISGRTGMEMIQHYEDTFGEGGDHGDPGPDD